MRQMSVGPFFMSLWSRGMWFRLWGYGLHVKLRAGHEKLFSERYGYRRALNVGPLRFEVLKPSEGMP